MHFHAPGALWSFGDVPDTYLRLHGDRTGRGGRGLLVGCPETIAAA
ncbi:hypothetical protein [Streptomyces chattanoogensis]|nr:hypothetical protein [Streptomyces chattanoogensis]